MTLLIPLLVALSAARAQDPAGSWRTISSEHYRLHYPTAAEAWATEAASRLESIRARVSVEVGYNPERIIDIVVLDPANRANGFALPLQRHPRMGVFPPAPSPDSGLGSFRSWYEELLTHEDTHLVHLLRPSRNRGYRALGELLGIGPLMLSSPRWVMEGYATLVEGKLSGSGRPGSDARAAFLRVLAREGRLPSYDGMISSGAWMGGSYAYLVGSAYLEWLEAREGEGALRDLWARGTARQLRGFEGAFTGVFGDSPTTLYARFKAELYAQAIAVDKARPVSPGELWLDLSRNTGSPALSHDGKHLALVEGAKNGPSKLKVYSTEEDGKSREKWQKKVADTLAKDPEDVAPKPPKTFSREPVATRAAGSRTPQGPRWMPGDKALLYAAWEPRKDGTTRPDLFVWEVESGRERRISRDADVYDPDPHPDGSWAVAMRQRWGANQLVRVDLGNGKTTELSPPDVRVLVSTPRFSPDGQTLAWLRHSGEWGVRLRDLRTNEERDLPLPGGLSVACLEWDPTGDALLLSIGENGFIEVKRAPLDGGPLEALSQTSGGAFSPVLSPDGDSLYYLSPDSGGLDLYRRDTRDPLPPLLEILPDLAPITRFTRPSAPQPPAPAPVSSDPYGFGRPELRPLVGGAAGPGLGRLDAGIRLGDLVGSWELLALYQREGAEDTHGGTAGLVWRGLPATLGADAWGATGAQGPRFGAAASTLWSGTPRFSRYAFQAGGFGESGEGAGGDGLGDRFGGFAGLFLGHTFYSGRGWFDLSGGGEGAIGGGGQLGESARGQASAGLGLGLGLAGLAAEWQSAWAPTGGPFHLGGTLDPILPDGVESARIADPALRPEAALVAEYHSLRLALGVPDGFELFGERSWLGADGADRVTKAGIHLLLELPRQSLLRLPETLFDSGVACILDAPGLPAPASPCSALGDWTLWAALGWSI